MDIFEEAFENLMNGCLESGDFCGSDENYLPSKIGLKDEISKDVLCYRLDKLRYSQSLLACFVANRGDFFDKYIRNIYWSDDSQKDREYEANMSYGRDFHLNCERIFRNIDVGVDASKPMSEEISRIKKIKSQYESRYKDRKIVFLPEYTIELSNKVTATYDLLVLVYDNDEVLENIFIWDWKMEKILDIKAEGRMQTKVYLYVCKESIGKNLPFENISMYYYMPKTNKNIRINYSEDFHEKNKNYIKSVIDDINKYKK